MPITLCLKCGKKTDETNEACQKHGHPMWSNRSGTPPVLSLEERRLEGITAGKKQRPEKRLGRVISLVGLGLCIVVGLVAPGCSSKSEEKPQPKESARLAVMKWLDENVGDRDAVENAVWYPTVQMEDRNFYVNVQLWFERGAGNHPAKDFLRRQRWLFVVDTTGSIIKVEDNTF